MSYAVRTLLELGPSLAFAPERHCLDGGRDAAGVPLSGLVRETHRRLTLGSGARALVLCTTQAKDGLIDLPEPSEATSAKTLVPTGALLVSRLRPYLRQIGLAAPALLALAPKAHRGLPLACSTEFSVLVPARPGESLAYLLPFLLSPEVQARLAAGQEGGHRPRVPRDTLLALRVPRSAVLRAKETSAAVEKALAALYRARYTYLDALGRRRTPSGWRVADA